MNLQTTRNNFRPNIPAKTIGSLAVLVALASMACFAQTSSVGQAAQGIATEFIAIAKWLGIAVMIFSGIAMAAGGSHGGGGIAKMSGMILGLVLALFATPLVAWIQAL